MRFNIFVFGQLKSLADTLSDSTSLTDAKEQLRRDFGVVEVELFDADGGKIHGRTKLRKAVSRAHSVELRLVRGRGENIVNEAPVTNTGLPTPSGTQTSESSVPPGEAVSRGNGDEDALGRDVDRFVREFDRRERTSGAMWAKHVVNEFLPDLGYPAPEAKRFLRQLESAGIIATTQVPSRDNPQFKATRFHLNRDHPGVRRALQPVPEHRPRIRFPDGGELVSELLIRERR